MFGAGVCQDLGQFERAQAVFPRDRHWTTVCGRMLFSAGTNFYPHGQTKPYNRAGLPHTSPYPGILLVTPAPEPIIA